MTDTNGHFNLNKTSDSDILIISGIGFKTKEVRISQSNLGEIIMYEDIELLDVQDTGTRPNKFSRKETAYVGKMSLKNMETATVYSKVSNEILESQILTTIDDALTNATGIAKLWKSTGRYPILGTISYKF